LNEELIEQLTKNTIEAGDVVTPADRESTEKNLQMEINNLRETIEQFNLSLAENQQDFAINNVDEKVGEFIGVLKAKAERGLIDVKIGAQPSTFSSELKLYKNDMFLQNRVDTLYNRAVDTAIENSLAYAFAGLTAEQIAQTELFKSDPVMAMSQMSATLGTEALSLLYQRQNGVDKPTADAHAEIVQGATQKEVDYNDVKSMSSNMLIFGLDKAGIIDSKGLTEEGKIELGKILHSVFTDAQLRQLENFEVDEEKLANHFGMESIKRVKGLDGLSVKELTERIVQFNEKTQDEIQEIAVSKASKIEKRSSYQDLVDKYYSVDKKAFIDITRNKTNNEAPKDYSKVLSSISEESHTPIGNILESYLDREFSNIMEPEFKAPVSIENDYRDENYAKNINFINIMPDGTIASFRAEERRVLSNLEKIRMEAQKNAQEQKEAEVIKPDEKQSEDKVEVKGPKQEESKTQENGEKQEEKQEEAPKKGFMSRFREGLKSISERRALGESLGSIAFKKLASIGEKLTNLPMALAKGKKQEELGSGFGDTKMAIGDGSQREEAPVASQEEKTAVSQPTVQASTVQPSFEDRLKVDQSALTNPNMQNGNVAPVMQQDLIEQAVQGLENIEFDQSVFENLPTGNNNVAKGDDEPEL
jgi:hypothetical protein